MDPAPSRPVRVLVVDDHPMVREGLRSMLDAEAVEVVGEAGSGAEAIQRAGELGPDIILLDVRLPDVDGLTVLRRLKEMAPQASVLIVSMHDDPALVRRAVDAGAAGYVLKGVSRRELLAAVQAVRYGESVLDPVLLRTLLADISASPVAGPPQRGKGEPLTRIEQDVLQLMAGGLTNKQISERMRWSVGTTKKCVQRILEKLQVSDRTQAAVEAVRRGFVG